MTGYLSLANGMQTPIHDGFVLGRVAGSDLVVDDSKASRRHAKLHVANGVVEIEDLASSNGTLLNDKPVTRRLLRDGDRIQIGKTVIVFREGELPGAQPAAAKPSVALDDNDLFGDAAATSIAAAPPPPPPPAPTAPPSPPRPALVVPPPAPASLPPPPRPPPKVPAAAPAVVEFADEVVEIRKAPPPAAAKAAPAAGPAVAAPASRVLQFSKQAAGRGGVLGDDMAQMSGGTRGLLVLGVLVGGAAIVWLVMQLVR